MTSWSDEFDKVRAARSLEPREAQRVFGDAVMHVVQDGGTLIGEAGVGTGKSFGYLIPLIASGKRSIVATETTTLQDQLVDKDLPFLREVFGGFTFRCLKGRTHYLCRNRAPREHGVLLRLGQLDLGDGQRRDVERVLGWPLTDDDWDVLRGDQDYCAQNKCTEERCYSTRARKLALDADIVITNHALIRTHADMDEGLLGEFDHLVVDEAHTLEKQLIDGWSEQMSPWERHTYMKSVWDGLNAAYLAKLAPQAEEAERLMKTGLESATRLFRLLAARQVTGDLTEYQWKRSNFPMSEHYLNGPQAPEVVSALEEYELQGPGRFKAASETFEHVAKQLRVALEGMDKGTRKVRKGATAAKRLARVCGMIAESLTTRDGTVLHYGVPYAVIGDGWKAWKGSWDVRVRCVPLDVSRRCRETVWKDPRSVTLVSGTLSDAHPGDFLYTLYSLGLEDAERLQTLAVNSPFDYAKQQLVYLTPEKETEVDVPGARFSLDEMRKVLDASAGRGLVLFTARSELDYAAEELLQRPLAHNVLVQSQNVNKQVLVKQFTEDTSSVLLATKSFFTGVDFPGETCSVVVLAKYPMPQYNTLCRAQIAWWRSRGFPNWYEREGALVARQAVGRLIRSESDHGVIALLDQRTGMHDKIMNACAGSYVTRDLEDVKQWLTQKS